MTLSRGHTRLAAVVWTLASLLGCGGSEPPPQESALIERFEANQTALAELLEWAKPKAGVFGLRLDSFDRQAAESQGLSQEEMAKLQSWASALDVESLWVKSNDPFELRLTVWYRDLFGPGGYEVAYAYREQEPRELAESIEPFLRPSLRNETEAFRRLEGNWYLSYWAAD